MSRVDEALREWVSAVESKLREDEAAQFRHVAERLAGEALELRQDHRVRLEVEGRFVFLRRSSGIPKRFVYAKVDAKGRVRRIHDDRVVGSVFDRERLGAFRLWGVEPALQGRP